MAGNTWPTGKWATDIRVALMGKRHLTCRHIGNINWATDIWIEDIRPEEIWAKEIWLTDKWAIDSLATDVLGADIWTTHI
jgi:hypothetical protein